MTEKYSELDGLHTSFHGVHSNGPRQTFKEYWSDSTHQITGGLVAVLFVVISGMQIVNIFFNSEDADFLEQCKRLLNVE